VQVRPDDGETEADRATVPANPLGEVTVIVDGAPLVTITDVGLAERLKSGDVTVIVWLAVPVKSVESVTVNWTLYEPAVAYAWVAV